MDFLEISAVLHRIATTGSTIQKENILKCYVDKLPGLKEVLQFIYDPSFTTGLKVKKLERVYPSDIGKKMTTEQIMEYLKKNNTGTDHDAMIALGFIYKEGCPVWEWAATGLVIKDLQIGMSVTTLNNIFGKSFIPKVGIMRGMLCPTDTKGIYVATEKIDGNRRLIMTKPTGIEIYTRSGKRDYGLIEIEEQAKQLPVGYVYDTECIAVGDFADSIECRQASASILNSRGKRTGVKALCFDVLPIEEYNEGVSKKAAFARKAFLGGIFGDETIMTVMHKWFMDNNLATFANTVNAQFCDTSSRFLPNITCLPILGIVTTYNEGITLAEPIWETGGEGVMLVEYRSPYEVNPNPRKTLLKIKANQEYTLLCTGVYEGENKYTGMLGAIEVQYRRPHDKNVYYVKVGSGFPDYLRQEYFENPKAIVGKFVEIESFGESRNAQGSYSLNCPIFKRIYGEIE